MMRKLYAFSFSFERGGAAIAARKFSRLAAEFSEVTCVSVDAVNHLARDAVSEARTARLSRGIHFLKRVISYILVKGMRDGNISKHSLNLFSSSVFLKNMRKAAQERAICHFHWINNDCLSLFDFKKIPPKSIITLHDEWLYCGTEHYHDLLGQEVFVSGYPFTCRTTKGPNWNWFAWKMKCLKLSGRTDLLITVPSHWMHERARRSHLLCQHTVKLLPNPIETQDFHPSTSLERQRSRISRGILDSQLVIVTGAVDGKKNPVKGFDLLEKALEIVSREVSDDVLRKVVLVSFGGSEVGRGEFGGIEVIHLGKIREIETLRRVYAMADFAVVPSLVESFGQVAAEALACGTPVVAFRCSGLQDIVIHQVTGLLADPYEPRSLAERIIELIHCAPEVRQHLGHNGREHVVNNFSSEVIARQYKEIVSSLC
ncbi:glycosyltransferase [Modicisalibacter sp. MOD 31.J]|uniref:glycosyltransferase n=2 Tax=unclassified Modicisalibacter TaxID=2679913 RepID=UPI001CCDCC20|nr:glycosyltransferase [Modicisalibacter sp. MOD 31.J]MBZ9575922.1 glycosyltransferase [Modicisalibacter sp. MOD 31.J]